MGNDFMPPRVVRRLHRCSHEVFSLGRRVIHGRSGISTMLRQYGVHLDGCISGVRYGDCEAIIHELSRNIASPRRLVGRVRKHVVGGRNERAVLTSVRKIISRTRVSILHRLHRRVSVTRDRGGRYRSGVSRVYRGCFPRRLEHLRAVPNVGRHTTASLVTRVNASVDGFRATGRLTT